MSKIIDITKLTLEEAKALLGNGTSVQDLLISVVDMSTAEYSSDTGKFEPKQELINKKSELANFCVAEGAKLKDAFKGIGKIPVQFIENNLPLIIESQYNPTEVLHHIVTFAFCFNNPLSLITKLINDYKADASKLFYIPFEHLDSSSIELLLSGGMETNLVLQGALNNKSQEKQKELLELAFKHGASSSSFKNLNNISALNLNEDVCEILITKYKISAQNLLSLVVHKSTSKYNWANQKFEPNQEMIAKQSALTNFLIGNGAKLQEIANLPSDFVKNNPELVKDAKEARYFSLVDFAPNDIEMDSVVSNLIKGVFVKQHYSKEYTEKTFLELCYALHNVMDISPTIAKVLSYVSQIPNLEIYIDDEGLSPNSNGTYHGHTGKIYIQPSNNNRVSTIVHECFHKAFDTLYKNTSRPYSPDDAKTKEQISKLIESDLLVQELVPGYESWFVMKYRGYEREEYDVELFTWLVGVLTSKILQNEEYTSTFGTREFTEEAWEILQKIVATMPVAGGTVHQPEAAPESLMLSKQENDVIQKALIKQISHGLFTINPHLDSSSIEFLLSKGMKVEVLLKTAFNVQNNKEKQKELLELAFKHGASSSSFKNLNNISAENLNEDVFKLLIDTYKVSLQDLLHPVVHASTSQYKELIDKQIVLKNFLIEKGAQDISNSWSTSILNFFFGNKSDTKDLGAPKPSTVKVSAEKELGASGEGLSTVAEPVKLTEVVATMGNDSVIHDSL